MLRNKVCGSHLQNRIQYPGKKRFQGGRYMIACCIKWDLKERTDCVTSVYSTSYWNESMTQKRMWKNGKGFRREVQKKIT